MTGIFDFHGPNAAYVLDLYERYQRDPAAVDAATRAFFQHWRPPPAGEVARTPVNGDGRGLPGWIRRPVSPISFRLSASMGIWLPNLTRWAPPRQVIRRWRWTITI